MKITYLLIMAILFVFFLQVKDPSVTEKYAFSGERLMKKPVVVVTSIFLHASLEHLLSNILALLFFGIAVENEMGKLKMLFIFFLGAFVGDLFSLFVYPWDALSVGASGGIFALVGTGMLVKPLDLSFYPLIVPLPLALIGVVYIIYNIYGFFAGPSNISYAAHIGGLIVGMISGLTKEGGRKGLVIVAFMFLLLATLPYIISLFL